MRGLLFGAFALCIACKLDGTDDTTDDPTDTDTDTDVETDVVLGDGNDDPSVATPIATPTCLPGQSDPCAALISASVPAISPAMDRDFYKVPLTEGTAYRLWTVAIDPDPQDDVAAKVDTVMRLYAPDGTLVAEADDMPFRLGNRDAAIVHQAATSGDYVLEVLDWTHWSNEANVEDALAQIRGGDDYQYQLFGQELPPTEFIANDTLLDANDDPDPSALYSPLPVGSAALREFRGRVDMNGDMDVWTFDIPEEQDGAYHSWTLWPDSWGGMAPEMTLYNDVGDVLATTLDVAPETTRAFTWDVSLLYRVTGGQRYFLSVTDSRLADEAGRFYAGIWQAWAPDLSQVESEPNDNLNQVNVLAFTESSSGSLYTARMSGLFGARPIGCNPDTDDTCRDDVEVIKVAKVEVEGTLSGRYLSIQFQADAVGSLADLRFTLQKQSGSPLCGDDADRCTAQLTPAGNQTDPALLDYQLTTNDDVFIVVTQDTAGIGPYTHQNAWFALVEVSTEPLYAR